MSGLTSSRVNCAKPREQLYGGVAFGALPRGMPCCERRVPSLRCLVALFVALNTLNYVDRGIIPGASEEFEAFICECSRDLGAHGCRHASTFLGLLQSVFIAGFSVASVVASNLLHRVSPFVVVGGGLVVWCCAVLLSAAARARAPVRAAVRRAHALGRRRGLVPVRRAAAHRRPRGPRQG